jgi:hypothetical protein
VDGPVGERHDVSIPEAPQRHQDQPVVGRVDPQLSIHPDERLEIEVIAVPVGDDERVELRELFDIEPAGRTDGECAVSKLILDEEIRNDARPSRLHHPEA